MSKHTRTLDQIERLNGGLWSKVEALLRHYRADVVEGSGSSVTFRLDGLKLTVHRPHPRKECGRGLVKEVRGFLKDTGRLK